MTALDIDEMKTPFGLIIAQDYEPHEAAYQWAERLGVNFANAHHAFEGTSYKFLVLAVHTPARMEANSPAIYLCTDDADLSRTLTQIHASVAPPISWRCAVQPDSVVEKMLLDLIPSHLTRLMRLETFQSMAPRIHATMQVQEAKKVKAAKKAKKSYVKAKKARKAKARAIKADAKAKLRKKKARARTRSTKGKSLTTS